jgi:hypothetical protein
VYAFDIIPRLFSGVVNCLGYTALSGGHLGRMNLEESILMC